MNKYETIYQRFSLNWQLADWQRVDQQVKGVSFEEPSIILISYYFEQQFVGRRQTLLLHIDREQNLDEKDQDFRIVGVDKLTENLDQVTLSLGEELGVITVNNEAVEVDQLLLHNCAL